MSYRDRVRMVLLSAAAVVLVSLLTVLAVLRRGGRGDRDLLAAHMRSIGDPGPARPAAVNQPGSGTPVAPRAEESGPWGHADDMTRRRVEDLARAGHRLQAVDALRLATGCRLVDAMAAVDRLPGTHGRQPLRAEDEDGGARGSYRSMGGGVRHEEPARAAKAHELLIRVRELAYGGLTDEAVRLLHEEAGMSRPEAEDAVARLTAER